MRIELLRGSGACGNGGNVSVTCGGGDGACLVWQGMVAGAPSAAVSAGVTLPRFEVASITKTFTATATLRLIEKSFFPPLDAPLDAATLGALGAHRSGAGLLGGGGGKKEEDALWRVVHRLLCGHGPGGGCLTLRQLLGHRSGLPDYWQETVVVGGRSVKAPFIAAFDGAGRACA